MLIFQMGLMKEMSQFIYYKYKYKYKELIFEFYLLLSGKI